MRAALVLGLVLAAACHHAQAPTSGNVAIRADDKGFTPSSVTLEKGAPAKLVFTRTTDQTCAKQVVFPDLKIKKDLPLDKPVEVDVPTTESRTLAFQCGMGMLKGSVVVE